LETIVAVMGIAHVDGVEQNLILNGWKPALPTCAAVKQ
jgi:pheromone shutdown protein TraB